MMTAPEGFEAPWQAQLFALQTALVDAGVFSPAEWATVLGDELRAGKPKPTQATITSDISAHWKRF